MRWKGADELLPYYQQDGVLMYGSRFIAETPEAARRWMVGYIRALREYYDAVPGPVHAVATDLAGLNDYEYL
ncbi:MAG TPA: hypothetical protein VII06_22010 [Chloroflexota bacterium]